MSERTWWETIKAEGSEALGKVKGIIEEGNVRRVRIKQAAARLTGLENRILALARSA